MAKTYCRICCPNADPAKWADDPCRTPLCEQRIHDQAMQVSRRIMLSNAKPPPDPFRGGGTDGKRFKKGKSA